MWQPAFASFRQRGPCSPSISKLRRAVGVKKSFSLRLRPTAAKPLPGRRTSWGSLRGSQAKSQTVKFARVKVSDLGFTNPKKLPTTREIWERIQELGHSLCEPGDGPAIRLALKDQPRGDYFWTAMEQISDSGGDPSVFHVRCNDDGTRWLYAYWVSPDDEWDLGSEIVFRLRK